MSRVIDYAILLHGLAQKMEVAKVTKFGKKGSSGDEDDAGTSNTRIAQRERAMPHTTMKNVTSVTLDD